MRLGGMSAISSVCQRMRVRSGGVRLLGDCGSADKARRIVEGCAHTRARVGGGHAGMKVDDRQVTGDSGCSWTPLCATARCAEWPNGSQRRFVALKAVAQAALRRLYCNSTAPGTTSDSSRRGSVLSIRLLHMIILSGRGVLDGETECQCA